MKNEPIWGGERGVEDIVIRTLVMDAHTIIPPTDKLVQNQQEYLHTAGSSWSRTYNDEKDEVDEIVEGVSIHDKIHYVHPALQRDHLKANQSK